MLCAFGSASQPSTRSLAALLCTTAKSIGRGQLRVKTAVSSAPGMSALPPIATESLHCDNKHNGPILLGVARRAARRQAITKRPLSLTLAYSCGVSECIFHSVPDMARNFYTVSARPGHERNLIVPDFAAHGRDRVAEGQDRFWIPCSGSRLELS